jgi:prolipoprotein diacylglyceryltransferase
VDLGDGIARHPVQLYESGAMAVFLATYLFGLKGRRDWAMQRGFYAMCIAYGVQRFLWEFLKPYPKLIGPFNIFHLMCVGLVAYGWIYDRRQRRDQRAQERAVPLSGTDHEPL